MKKLLLFAVAVFAFSFNTSFGQITLTSANMPGSGDTLRYSSCRPSSINTTTTGANIFWNYDTLTYLNQGLYEYKAAYQTPYFFYFGVGQYGLKVADTIGFGTFSFTDVYNFFKKTSSAYTVEGTGFKYQGAPLATQYSDEDEIYSFPLNYLDHDSTTFKFSVSFGTGMYYEQHGYRINDVDGWGVIKTPFDSVACLRLVSTSYATDSVNVSGFGFSYPNVQRTYKWVSTTQKIPVLEVQGAYNNGNFNAVRARYRDSMRVAVGINEEAFAAGTIKVFPNPAADEAYVLVKDVTAEMIKFFNVAGQEIRVSRLNGMLSAVSLSGMAEGIYFYSVLDENGKVLSGGKLVITN